MNLPVSWTSPTPDFWENPERFLGLLLASTSSSDPGTCLTDAHDLRPNWRLVEAIDEWIEASGRRGKPRDHWWPNLLLPRGESELPKRWVFERVIESIPDRGLKIRIAQHTLTAWGSREHDRAALAPRIATLFPELAPICAMARDAVSETPEHNLMRAFYRSHPEVREWVMKAHWKALF